jgi:hypothetical protein
MTRTRKPGGAPERPWYHLDNGFTSEEGMRRLHRPVVALARAQLNGLTGNVLDLGCGNGALLSKICDGLDGMIPYGVDKNRRALKHACKLLPQFAPNFVIGDLFDGDLWQSGRRYALVMLMARRLLEVERPMADRLLKDLEGISDTILLYTYTGSGSRSLVAMVRSMRLKIRRPSDGAVALLERRPPATYSLSD